MRLSVAIGGLLLLLPAIHIEAQSLSLSITGKVVRADSGEIPNPTNISIYYKLRATSRVKIVCPSDRCVMGSFTSQQLPLISNDLIMIEASGKKDGSVWTATQSF